MVVAVAVIPYVVMLGCKGGGACRNNVAERMFKVTFYF
jgi:hypothetical protein